MVKSNEVGEGIELGRDEFIKILAKKFEENGYKFTHKQILDIFNTVFHTLSESIRLGAIFRFKGIGLFMTKKYCGKRFRDLNSGEFTSTEPTIRARVKVSKHFGVDSSKILQLKSRVKK